MISNSVAFWHELTQMSLCSFLLNLETPNEARSVAEQSWNIQTTSNCSDQAARIRRLVWAFAGHTCHIVGNFVWGAKGLSLTSITALCPWARHINPSLVLVQPRKTRPYITERLLMGRKELNQTKNKHCWKSHVTGQILYQTVDW